MGDSPTRAPRASLTSLGCRVNQYEVRELAAELLRRGYRIVPFGQPADVTVVNTCTVTAEADTKSRATLRRAARTGDDPLVVAMGCYVDSDPDGAAAVPGVGLALKNGSKPQAAELVDEALRRSGRLLFDLPELADAGAPGELVRLLHAGEGVLARTRAVIKVQDGCNHFCSFCIIPFTRGRLRSRPAAAVLEEATALVELGYRELVLTGICLGDYGDERGFENASPRRDPLALLLEQLAALPGLDRIRLSSLDPADISEDLIQTLATLPAACHHFHLSLQAGDESVLARMRRRYTAVEFRALVDRLYGAMPDAGLTCDVIAGFPGESPEQFEETVRLCEASRFCKIHAFPYSPRTGTSAARWEDDVALAEKQRRVAVLQQLSDRLGREFAERHVGQQVVVLFEQEDRKLGVPTGLTGNYLRVRLQSPTGESLAGQLFPVEVTGCEAGTAIGRLSA